MKKPIRKSYSNYPSYFDLKDENSYHVLMLGLCIIVSDSYEIMSNQEKGYGRADIYLKSKKGQRDIVIEMKYAEMTKKTAYWLLRIKR